MLTFDKYKTHLLDAEGESYNPNDKPFGSKFGVSAAGWEEVFKTKIDAVGIQNMTKSTAFIVYQHWFDKMRLAEFNDPDLALLLGDIGFNIGMYRAAKFLQGVLNDNFGFTLETKSGIIGAKTLAAANSVSKDLLFNTFYHRIEVYYRSECTGLNCQDLERTRLNKFFALKQVNDGEKPTSPSTIKVGIEIVKSSYKSLFNQNAEDKAQAGLIIGGLILALVILGYGIHKFFKLKALSFGK